MSQDLKMTQDELLCVQILKNYVDELHDIDDSIKQLKERREEVLQLKIDLMNELKYLKEKDYLEQKTGSNSLTLGD